MHDIITAPTAASLLGVTEARLRKLIEGGRITAYVPDGDGFVERPEKQPGRKLYYKRSEIETFASHRKRGAGRPVDHNPAKKQSLYNHEYYERVRKQRRAQED